ncbi:MAG: DMT family transporter [Candidatus Rifleibacteriota bacterium]
MALKDWFWLIFLSVIWGSSFMFLKTALIELPPYFIVLFRLSIASAFLLSVCRLRGLEFPVSARAWFSLGFLGIINTAAPFLAITWAQQYIDTATASILNATSPIFVMILAQFFTDDEKLSVNKIFGVLSGLAGITVMVAPGLVNKFELVNLGPFGVLCGTFMYAAAGIYAKRFRLLPSTMVSAVSLLGGLVFMLPGLLFVEFPAFATLHLKTWLSVIFLGMICTGTAYLIYFRLIASSGATNALLVTLLIPVSAFIFSVTIMNETIRNNDVYGMLLIGAGLLIIDGRLIRFPGVRRLWFPPKT